MKIIPSICRGRSRLGLSLLILLTAFLSLEAQPRVVAHAGGDTLVVRFRFQPEQPARKITLIGTFNGFDKRADRLRGPDSTGTWWIEKRLPYGEYQYRFLIDDKIYRRDPANPLFGGEHSNSLLYLDPPGKPHLKITRPLPGQRIRELPLRLEIQFLPGSRTDRIDRKRSVCTLDGKPLKLRYRRKQHLLTAEITALSEGLHSLSVRLTDKKGNSTRRHQTIFWLDAVNQPPRAEAGYSLFARPGETVRLNAGLSADDDLDDLRFYRWRFLGRPGAVDFDTSRNSPFPRVTCQRPGNYRFQLQVADSLFRSAPDTVTLFCRDFPRTYGEFRLAGTEVARFAPVTSVSVAGEFNRWQADANPMIDSAGVWRLRLPLPPGRYEYKFVINGRHWIPDPGNPDRVEDGWNGFNSLITVPPYFGNRPEWRINLTRRGLTLRNSLHKPFEFLNDDNNPLRVALAEDSLLRVPPLPADYFTYELADSAGAVYPPKIHLFRQLGHGEIDLVDFAQSPGWARRAVTYQIFLRRFAKDSSRTATFRELRGDLDYLQDLGVDAIWLMPIMESNTPHGYTPTDYFSVETDYGTLADFDSLIADLHRRGMRFIFDFVANHSSDQHPFFLSAWQNPRSVFRHWYIWKGRWQYDYHNDWDQLPNLNYRNPNVRNYMLKVAEFWAKRGVDGFRCDAAWGVPHDFWKDFRRRVKGWNPHLLLLDEVLPRDPAYHHGEFDMSYDTDFYGNVLDVFRGKKSVSALRMGLEKTRVNYPPTAIDLRYLENQDLPRFIAQFGPPATRLAATLLFTLPGMPLIYYGQELGMTRMRGAMRWELAGNDMFRFYRRLIHLRKDHPAFYSDKLTFLTDLPAPRVLAYLREAGTERLLVLLNFSPREQTFAVPLPAEQPAVYLFGDQPRGPGIHPVDLQRVTLDGYGFLIVRLP